MSLASSLTALSSGFTPQHALRTRLTATTPGRRLESVLARLAGAPALTSNTFEQLLTAPGVVWCGAVHMPSMTRPAIEQPLFFFNDAPPTELSAFPPPGPLRH